MSEKIVGIALNVMDGNNELVYTVSDLVGLNIDEDGVIIKDKSHRELNSLLEKIKSKHVTSDDHIWNVHFWIDGIHLWSSGKGNIPIWKRGLKIYFSKDYERNGFYFEGENGTDLFDKTFRLNRINILEHSEKPKLLLIRGLPGSGKTTLVNKLINDPDEIYSVNHEADHFFSKSGQYQYDRKKIDDAHLSCLLKTRRSLLDGKNVIVSNTFVRSWEIKPYLNLASDLGIEVEVEEVNGNYPNIHGVPETVIEQMRTNWENL